LDYIRETAMRQLSELPPAPSVGMHDVPRESVGQHLGFGKDEEEGRDSLDASVAQHARFVYNLQETDTHSDDSDDPDVYRWDSDDSVASSSRRRRYAPKASKKRMSILTNQYYDIPSYENGFEYAIAGKPESRRRFFQSVARWDARYQEVVVPGRDVIPLPHLDRLMKSPVRTPRYSDDDVVGGGDVGEEDGSAEEDDEVSGDLETESGYEEDYMVE